jgi:hypothetical protein
MVSLDRDTPNPILYNPVCLDDSGFHAGVLLLVIPFRSAWSATAALQRSDHKPVYDSFRLASDYKILE